MGVHQSTYRRLDMDTAVNKYGNDSYCDARNFRLINNDNLKSGAFSNIQGNKLIISAFPGYANDHYIGSVRIRDYIIIFSTDDNTSEPTASDGRIWKVPFGKNNLVSGDFVCLYDGVLNFSRQNPIEDAVSYYENESVQKIYWTDGYNHLRYANVATYLTTDGLVISGGNSYINPDNFSISQPFNISTPSYSKMTSGYIPVGMVQYAYRLYKLKGGASNFSPASVLIPLTDSSLSLDNSKLYKGADYLDDQGNPKSSDKGVEMFISEVDEDYDRVEIVAIHYSSINAVPTINIVGIYSTSSSAIYFNDVGDYSRGSYSLSEFVYINNPVKCKTLTSKNNILFPGGIEQEEFDLVYDTRAHRYSISNHNHTFTQLFQKDGSYYLHTALGASWNYYNSSGVYQATYGYSNLPSNADAINELHNLSLTRNKVQDANWAYIYQEDGSTLGGKGPNVKYSFESKSTILPFIDSNSGAKTFHTPSAVNPTIYYQGNASPRYNQEYSTWARDETYRMGAILIDDKGRASPPKWIGDVRMPNQQVIFDTEKGYYYIDIIGAFQQPIQVKFEFSNLPADVKYVQIVYVKRENKDKTCLFQGRMGWFWKYSPSDTYYTLAPPYLCRTDFGYTRAMKHCYIVSPELSFYKNYETGEEDWIEVIGRWEGILSIYSHNRVSKFGAREFLTSSTAAAWNKVADGKMLIAKETPDEERTAELFSGLLYMPYVRRKTGATMEYIGDHGTCGVFNTVDNIAPTYWNLPSAGYPIVNYRRNRYGVQYGGNAFQDRTRNEYIPAGPVAEVVAGEVIAHASYGDTWIDYHDQLTSFYNSYYAMKDKSKGDAHIEMEYFPVETSINLSYRHDDCYHIISDQVNSEYIREKGNAEFTIEGDTFSYGWSDLYLYNTVYSRRHDVRKHYSAPVDYNPQALSDTLVMASNMKMGNEDIDPWTIFASNESITLDNKYGILYKLIQWKNLLLYFQENAVGMLSVLERSLIQDSEGKNVMLGQGEILQRYDNIATNIGISTRFSWVESMGGLYWYDQKRKKIYRFREGIEDLVSAKGVNSYMNAIPDNYIDYNNPLVDKGFIMSYNPIYNEIWFTVKDAHDDGLTLIYNEVLDSYTGFLETKANHQFAFDKKLYSIYNKGVYLEDEGNYGYYYGVYHDSYVKLIVVPVPNIASIISNYEITTEVYEGLNPNHGKTITKVRTQNDYQDTGLITLSGSNSRRLVRTWRVNAGRNESDSARLRDTYGKVTLLFENDSNNRNIVLHDLLTLYAVPAHSMANKMQK